MKEKQRIINEQIKSSRVQLVMEDGKVEEMSINDARIRAREKSLDLMEVGKKGKVSIVKMLDYGKFLYREKKNSQKQKAMGKSLALKTLKITFKISEHDLNVRRNQAIKFAKIGHPLRVSLMLKGRENHYVDIAREKMKTFIEMISDIYKLEGKINKTGNVFSAMLKVIK